MLGQNIARVGSLGKAVTSVPKYFYHRDISLHPPADRDGIDFVADVLRRFSLLDTCPPLFDVTFHFLSRGELLELLENTVDELMSPDLTKSDKEKRLVPILKVLYGKDS